MKKDAKFYFANLCADALRCVAAAERDDEKRYISSLSRARRTLRFLRHSNRPEAYEEGQLLISGLKIAHAGDRLEIYSQQLNKLTTVDI